eukprot:8216360-Pyramimonas_sp.AAC.1
MSGSRTVKWSGSTKRCLPISQEETARTLADSPVDAKGIPLELVVPEGKYDGHKGPMLQQAHEDQQLFDPVVQARPNFWIS